MASRWCLVLYLKKATKAKQKEWNGEARRTPIWGDPVAQDGQNSQAQESLAMVVMAFLRGLNATVIKRRLLVIEIIPGGVNASANQNGCFVAHDKLFEGARHASISFIPGGIGLKSRSTRRHRLSLHSAFRVAPLHA